MQGRFVLLLLLLGIVGGGGLLLQRYKIRGLDAIRLEPRSTTAGDDASVLADDAESAPNVRQPPVTRQADTIQIATFYLPRFTDESLRQPKTVRVLSGLLSRFDVIAIQGVGRPQRKAIRQLAAQIPNRPAGYRWVAAPPAGLGVAPEPLGFLYDPGSLEIDRSATYVVEDPDDLLEHDPLVASFRVRGPPPDQAFTFTLVNVWVSPTQTDAEMAALDDVWNAVRRDGRGEDDVLLLGHLNAPAERWGELGLLPQIDWVIHDLPTNTRGTQMLDNLLYFRLATVEFTGESGVVDLMRTFDLSMRDAVRISEFVPVWAEFELFEGGDQGRVAADPSTSAPH